jgi:hypothetical protein
LELDFGILVGRQNEFFPQFMLHIDISVAGGGVNMPFKENNILADTRSV